MIGMEQYIIYPFGGRMHLCDYGADVGQCHLEPDAPNCRGPDGTALSYPRLYSYHIWSVRTFYKETLDSIFPHRGEDILKVADPGEYGIENYWCRAACVFIFMT